MGFLKKTLPKGLYKFLFNIYENYIGIKSTTYSQEGEDLVLRKIFSNIKKGFFVDVGAYHPKTYSNTYYFYKKGWTGINIDANPLSIRNFKKFRKKDINLNIGISKKSDKLDYYTFESGALNTFSEEVFNNRVNNDEGRFLKKISIPTQPLELVLDNNLPKNQEIDFINIDVEGYEMQVLTSNNWEKYRPKVILVEEYLKNINSFNDSEVYQFLHQKGYILNAKTFNTFIFIDIEQFKRFSNK